MLQKESLPCQTLSAPGFVPVYWGGGAAAQRITLTGLGLNVLLACTLVFQFRIWDDLNDLEDDRLSHPTRALSQASSVIYFFGSSGFLVDVRSTPAPLCSFCGTGIDHCALA